MKPSSAKQKGRKFQQLIRDLLLKYADSLTPDDVRSTSMGAGGEDILLSTAARAIYPWVIECKAQERLNVWAAYAQAKSHRDATIEEEGSYPEFFEPILFINKNRHTPLVVMDAEFFVSQRYGDVKNGVNTPNSDESVTNMKGGKTSNN